jgi:hypothetical protein
MKNQMDDNFNDKFEDEIKQSYLDLSDKMPLPPSNAFARIMDSINADEKKQKENIQQSLFEKITEFLHGIVVAPKVGWAVAGVQFAVIMFLILSPPASDMGDFQTLSINTASDKGVEVNIVFQDNALQKDISQLMINSGAIIVNGPNESGLYVLKVKHGHDLEIRLETIGNSKIVKFMNKRY